MIDTFDVEMPDGTIIEGVPVGTTRSQLEARLGRQSAPQQSAPAPVAAPAPMKSGYYNAAPGEEVGPVMQFLGGAKHAWDRAAAGLQSAAGAVGLPTGESLQPLVRQGTQFVKETGPASTVGQIAGDVAMSAAPAIRATQAGHVLARTLATKPWQVGATMLGSQAAANAGYGALTADQGKGAEGAAWGAGGTLAAHSMLPLARAAGGGVANVLGMTTGAGGESVKQAFRNAPGFVDNMRGNVEPGTVVDQARQGLQTMRQKMLDDYKTGKNAWAADKTPLDFSQINNAYHDTVNKFSFKGEVHPGIEEVRKKSADLIFRWRDMGAENPAFFTIEGLDALKRQLNDIYPTDLQNRTGRAFVNDLVDSVKSTIVKQSPKDYQAAMRDYWQWSNQLDEIERSLSLGDRNTIDTALRKLQSLPRNNVNANFGQRRVSADVLAQQGGQDVMPAVAGQALNKWTPRGLQTVAGIGGVMANPSSWPVLPTLSPRAVGEAARYGGKLWDKTQVEAAIKALRHGVGPAVAGKRDERK